MKQRAFIFIIITGVLWGTSGIFVHHLAPYGFSSMQMSFMRSAVSFSTMFLYALAFKRELFRISAGDICFFALTGLALFGTGSCYYASLQLTSISTAVVLMYTAPVYVVIFSVLFFGEKLSKKKITSVSCMLVGCALVSGIVGGMKFDTAGILIGVLSGISYGAYNILTKLAMRRGVRPMSATLYTFFFMALISFILCDPANLVANAAIDPARTVPLMLGIGLVTHVSPYILYTLALKELDAGVASSLSIVEPMSATIFSVMLFGEQLDVFSGTGIVLITLAVFLLGREEGSSKERQKEITEAINEEKSEETKGESECISRIR